ncbi:MAG: hypothetical protein QX197_01310 [Methylococcaceae bacterium]
MQGKNKPTTPMNIGFNLHKVKQFCLYAFGGYSFYVAYIAQGTFHTPLLKGIKGYLLNPLDESE